MSILLALNRNHKQHKRDTEINISCPFCVLFCGYFFTIEVTAAFPPSIAPFMCRWLVKWPAT